MIRPRQDELRAEPNLMLHRVRLVDATHAKEFTGLAARSADIAVRLIPSTSDIKVGVLTSIIGVPFFLYLIMRERRALGGGVA